ncbi:MAG: type 2 lanthipeptide synthetase LanM [Vicinamibacterales bacterium]
MSLGTEDLCDIVARSSTVFERGAPPFVQVDARDAERVIAARLDTWKQRVGAGSDERFRRYLAWCGWDEAAARRAVAPCAFVGERLPPWAEVLAEVEGVRQGTPDPIEATDGGDEQAFEHALLPFVDVARRRLALSVPSSRHGLDTGALRAFERALLRRLSRIAGRTLYAEFGGFRLGRAAATPGGHHLLALEAAARGEPRALYTGFIRWLGHGGRAAILRRYPVLARCLGTRVVDWVAATAELARRLDADGPLLERVFADGEPIGAVTDADPELSDPHGGGRTVVRVRFASGLTLIYKPRSLGLERAFSILIEWLNDGRASLELKAPQVLDCGTHGWMEYVAPGPCRALADVRRFYRRTGMLLSLAHVLGAADLHHENVIACGEFPVLVDLEVLMMSRVRADMPADRIAHEPAGQEIWDSVLRTGLLPINRLGVRGEVRRNGGLLHTLDAAVRTDAHWSRVNTDLMTITAVRARPTAANVPYVAGEPACAADHVTEVIAGFVEMREALRRERRALVEGGALEAFRRQRTRVVIRDTELYLALLQRALHPRLLHDGAEWSIELDVLKTACTTQHVKPSVWSATVAEGQALSRLDVPLFQACSEDTHLRADDRMVVREFLSEPGFTAAISRLIRLADEDAQVQVECIRLVTQCARKPVGQRPPTAIGPVDMVRETRGLADLLGRMAFPARDGGLDWLGVRGNGASSVRSLHPIRWDLYSGRCGVALFLAALERCGVTDQSPSMAQQTLGPLVSALHAGSAWLDLDVAAGAVGAGGLVYALTRIAQLLESQALLEAAASAARALTPELIARHESFDVVTGLAGSTLGLLGLYEASPADWLLERAACCGQRLVQCSSRAAGARRVWKTADARVYHGFAHGSAGIAYALARLHRATADPLYRVAALDALGPLLHEAPVHWTNEEAYLEESVSMAMRQGWCRGSAGLGLSRLGISKALNNPDVLNGLPPLLRQAAPSVSGLGPFDQLCCGNMARVELLIEGAACALAPRFPSLARELAELVVSRATHRGSYAISGVDDVFSPGFYHGLSGIGYEMLRLTFDELPSVLLWE